MTEYTSSNRIIGTLIQIKEAIKQYHGKMLLAFATI